MEQTNHTQIDPTSGKMYFAYDGKNVLFLVPKKRGTGFVKTPAGQHGTPLTRFVDDLGCDADGLEGYLTVETRGRYGTVKEDLFSSVVSPLAKFLGVEVVETTTHKLLDYVLEKYSK